MYIIFLDIFFFVCVYVSMGFFTLAKFSSLFSFFPEFFWFFSALGNSNFVVFSSTIHNIYENKLLFGGIFIETFQFSRKIDFHCANIFPSFSINFWPFWAVESVGSLKVAGCRERKKNWFFLQQFSSAQIFHEIFFSHKRGDTHSHFFFCFYLHWITRYLDVFHINFFTWLN